MFESNSNQVRTFFEGVETALSDNKALTFN
jgi:hypothetical protein